MPRQRRRRRRRAQGSIAPIEAAPGRGEERRARPRWRPTLPLLIAFSGGLWIGATLSFADEASAVGLIIGVLGLAIGGARLLGQRLREDRVRKRREAMEAEGGFSEEDGPD